MRTYLIVLLSLLLLPICGFGQAGSVPQKPERSKYLSDLNSNMGNIRKALFGDSDNDIPCCQISIQEFANYLREANNNLYALGFANLVFYNAHEVKVKACESAHTKWKGDGAIANWVDYINKCVAASGFNPPAASCIQEGAIAAGGECCGNKEWFVAAPNFLHEILEGNSCKKNSETCTAHTDCCSKVCEFSRDSDFKTGTCAQTLSCYKLIELDKECSEVKPYCKDGTCMPIDYNSSGIGECAEEGVACSADSDCCSDRCSNGKCAIKAKCMKCAKHGEVLTDDVKQCCPGLIPRLNDGTKKQNCIPDMPPFVLPINVMVPPKDQATLLQKVTSVLSVLPIVHAEEMPVDTGAGGSTTQQGGSNQSGTEEFVEDSTVTGGDDSLLSSATLKSIESKFKECMAMQSMDQRKPCMEAAVKLRKDKIAEAKKNGAEAKTKSQKEYVADYKMPSFKPALQSDIKQCKFNTQADNWNDASNLQRNGELFLRAFEVANSGQFTNDYWYVNVKLADGTTVKKSIGGHTQDIRKELRNNRVSLAYMYKQADHRLTCECVMISGPDRFDAETQLAFFMNCPEEVDAYARSLNEVQSGDGENNQGIVGLSGDALNKEVNRINTSALGAEHQMMLSRWLQIRADLNRSVFYETADIDARLQEMVVTISNTNFLTGTTDLNGKRTGEVNNDPKMTSEPDHGKLRSWAKVQLKGWVVFVAFLVLGPIALLFDNVRGSMGSLTGGWMIALMFLNPGHFFMAAALQVIQSFSSNMSAGLPDLYQRSGTTDSNSWKGDAFFKNQPHWENVNYDTNNCYKKFLGICTEEKKWYRREVRWPYYSNGVAENECKIHNYSRYCVKNFYHAKPDPAVSGLPQYQPLIKLAEGKMLNDISMPDFYPDQFVEDHGLKAKYNEGYEKGLKYLKDKGDNYSAQPNDKGQFAPDLSSYVTSSGFKVGNSLSVEQINKYKEAVSKYARCVDLKDCGATNLADVPEGLKQLPGFTDIFTNEADAKVFANYVYQIHFYWKNMGGQSGMGYPMSYHESYYSSLSYNIRLITTLAVRKFIEFQEGADMYAQTASVVASNYGVKGARYDLLKKNANKKNYGKLAAKIKLVGINLGSNGKLLDMQAFNPDAKLDGSGLSSAELTGLKMAAGLAVRVKKDYAALSDWKKKVGDSERGKKKLAAAKKFLGGLNNATGMMGGSMANSKDSSSYSGFGGDMENNGGKVEMPKVASAAPYVPAPTRNDSAANWGAGAGNNSSYASSTDDGGVGTANSTATADDSANSNLLEQADKYRSQYEGNDNDSLFQRVSKAYVRNLDKVLKRKSRAEPETQEAKVKGPEVKTEGMSDADKEAIRSMFNSSEVTR